MKKNIKQFIIFILLGIAINLIVKNSFNKRGLENIHNDKEDIILEEETTNEDKK